MADNELLGASCLRPISGCVSCRYMNGLGSALRMRFPNITLPPPIVLMCVATLVGCRSTAPRPEPAPEALVQRLDLDRYRNNIETLAGFGTRYWSTEGNRRALEWLEGEFESWGYEVERHRFLAASSRDPSQPPTEIENIYVTKVGSRNPGRMYIVSAHMDSFNFDSPDHTFAPGADDDASGTSLVLEMARVFSSADVETDVSVRFVLWNAEEAGLLGSAAYVEDRRGLQGIEDPAGSGRFPEPEWLGVIQHDMMMFDHGLPGASGRVSEAQSEAADIDIEYDADNSFDGAAIELAASFLAANSRYSGLFPAEVGRFMQSTDSVSFAPYTPAISLRENERRGEIGRGSNPRWHRNTDVFPAYGDADFRLGFAALQTSTGAVAELSGASLR